MSAATTCRQAILESWWSAPLAWAFARALVTSMPLERLRAGVGRRWQLAGYFVTCVPCVSAWTAAAAACVVALDGRDPWLAVPAWAGAWAGALLLDAAHDKLRAADAEPPEDSSTQAPGACVLCGGDLAGAPDSEVAVILSAPASQLRRAHRSGRCPRR